MNSKNIIWSKTFWLNVLALIGFVVQFYTNWVLPPEWQAGALGVINLILRAVTKQPVTLT